MDDISIIQAYLNDINEVLKITEDKDILLVFKELYDKEQSFAKRLISSGPGRNIYMQFIQKINDGKGGIKMAKSYFRARQESFLNTINKGIRDVQPKLMYGVPINYRFCLFAIENIKNEDKKLLDLFHDIKNLRNEIINKHLYLSMSRAKVFRENAYGSFTEFEDLIQISNEGLIVAVDKYVMDDNSSDFHEMAIGRMIAGLIQDGEETSSATIGEHGKKKLYKIRRLLQKNSSLTQEQIASIMEIAEDEVVSLMGATSYKSMDDFIGDDSETRMIENFTREVEVQDNQYDKLEKDNLLSVLSQNYDVLSIIEKKVLRLKGVAIDDEDYE